MRWIFFVTVIFISLVLSVSPLVPVMFPEDIERTSSPNYLIFTKGIANIKRVKNHIQECLDKKNEEGGEAQENKEQLNNFLSTLKELEVILVYQNYLIAKNNYIEAKEKSLRREPSPVDVNSAYREYESAKLYLERMIEQYPESLNIIGSIPK